MLHEGVLARFPWTVIDYDNGEPALWQHDAKVGKVPLRFRSEALARARGRSADRRAAEKVTFQ